MNEATHQDEIALLRARVEYLEALCDMLVCLIWEQRGVYKGLYGRMEKDVEPFFKKHLENVVK